MNLHFFINGFDPPPILNSVKKVHNLYCTASLVRHTSTRGECKQVRVLKSVSKYVKKIGQKDEFLFGMKFVPFF